MAELRAQLATTLGAAYTLERELGGAGMSRVFVAEEKALGRGVVVKVLPSEATSHVSVERFKREIALAARLQHPHIVPVLSAGETEGLPYFTMPFIEGESLRARLTRSVELPIADAVRLGWLESCLRRARPPCSGPQHPTRLRVSARRRAIQGDRPSPGTRVMTIAGAGICM
jgi:serine/threonine protein kinase